MKCVTCRWYEMDPVDRGMVCVNANSENCGDWMDYNDSCDQYEEDEPDET